MCPNTMKNLSSNPMLSFLISVLVTRLDYRTTTRENRSPRQAIQEAIRSTYLSGRNRRGSSQISGEQLMSELKITVVPRETCTPVENQGCWNEILKKSVPLRTPSANYTSFTRKYSESLLFSATPIFKNSSEQLECRSWEGSHDLTENSTLQADLVKPPLTLQIEYSYYET